MVEKTIKCAECGDSFTYPVPTNYPDKRKYCMGCSERKKAQWEHKDETPVAEKVEAPKNEWNANNCNASIVAQVILKGAVELTREQSNDFATIGEQLCAMVNELTGAYKLALSNVKAL